MTIHVATCSVGTICRFVIDCYLKDCNWDRSLKAQICLETLPQRLFDLDFVCISHALSMFPLCRPVMITVPPARKTSKEDSLFPAVGQYFVVVVVVVVVVEEVEAKDVVQKIKKKLSGVSRLESDDFSLQRWRSRFARSYRQRRPSQCISIVARGLFAGRNSALFAKSHDGYLDLFQSGFGARALDAKRRSLDLRFFYLYQ